MARIGYEELGGFIAGTTNEGDVLACGFTSNFAGTLVRIVPSVNDGFGAAGTAYAAIYADATGPAGAPLATGSAAYSSLQGGWLEIDISLAISDATKYWLCWYADTAGTFNVDGESDQDLAQEIRTWNEGTPGSWTTDPTHAQHSDDRVLSIFADTAASTTTTTSTSTSSSSSTSTSTSTSSSTSSSSSSSTSTTTQPASPVQTFSVPTYSFEPRSIFINID